METEYQVRTAWVNSKVSSNFVMTSIFIPLSVIIVFSYFSVTKEISQWIYLLTSALILGFWRYYAYHIDRKIIEQYYRICELEEDNELQINFIRKYLKDAWFLEPESNAAIKAQEVDKKIKGSSKWELFNTRGHNVLNVLAPSIFVIEAFVLFHREMMSWFIKVWVPILSGIIPAINLVLFVLYLPYMELQDVNQFLKLF